MKVCFLSWHFGSPELFLQTLIKMTPNCSGKWKDMEAVTNPEEADFVAIFDGYNGPYPQDRALFFGQHPKVEQHSPSFRKWENKKALGRYPLDEYWNAGEWWLGLTFDDINALKASDVKKDKNLACCMTYQTHIAMYKQRVTFMEECVKVIEDLDLYGRPEENFRTNPAFANHYKGVLGMNNYDAYKGEHLIGKETLMPYRYSLEFDVGPTFNYISERFYDALFMWIMPIYFGSNNVQDILPEESFRYIDIQGNVEIESIKALDISCSEFREQNLSAMAEARNLLLTKYQTWPYVYNKIKEL